MSEEYDTLSAEPESLRRSNRSILIIIVVLLLLCFCCVLIAVLGIGWLWTYGDALVGITQLRLLLLT